MIVHCKLVIQFTTAKEGADLLTHFHSGVPCFSDLIPVLSMDDDDIIRAWGTPGPAMPAKSTDTEVYRPSHVLSPGGLIVSYFDVKYTLPLRWLAALAKKFPGTHIAISYASLPMVTHGLRIFKGAEHSISETHGSPEAVESMILSHFPKEAAE